MAAIALVSTYEGGMQPLAIATAAAHLIAARHQVQSLDAFVTPVDAVALSRNDLVGLSIPLFESVDAAVTLLAQLRAADRDVTIVCYGSHAMLNQAALLERGAAGIVCGDWEEVLVEAASRVERRQPLDGIPGLATRDGDAAPVYVRRGHRVPHRADLPPLTQYRYSEAAKRIGPDVVVANVETARGCRFACSYCSVFAANPQKVTLFPEDIVLADLTQVVESGATHVCFTDAEFSNAPQHSLKIARRLHEAWPDLTFDFTTRADLIVKDPRRIEELVACGARFVTTAFEFPKQEVLDAVNKQMTVDMLEEALRVCRAAGLGVNPTFLLFNPWTTFEDLRDFSEFLERNGLENDVEPVQLETRLWLYKGSPLLQREDVRARIVAERPFHYEWRHSDPNVEDVFALAAQQPAPAGTTKRCCLKC